jgi:ubiquinone/menaquinone biosynthesis C-methylase UbiE
MMDVLEQKKRAIGQHSRQAEEFAERYRALERDAYQSCFTYSRRRLDMWLERMLPSSGRGLRLLDVGCGTGNQLVRLAKRGFDVAGIDGSSQMLVQARAINPAADIRQADVEAIPFSDNTFDVILCIEVLRYLPCTLACLREMARVLKPGGLCLATATPLFNLNGYWLVNRVAHTLKLRRLVPLKQFFTTSRRLRRELARAGFDTNEVHGVYFGPINWVERIFPRSLAPTLRRWERVDAALADRWVLREFSNMFLVRAEKGTTRGSRDA